MTIFNNRFQVIRNINVMLAIDLIWSQEFLPFNINSNEPIKIAIGMQGYFTLLIGLVVARLGPIR